MHKFVALALLASGGLILGSCGTLTAPPAAPRTHVVLMWLRHPERRADREQLVRSVHSMRMMRGVQKAETATSVADLPPGADRSFDLAALITFRDVAALQRFEKDPRHLEAMRRYARRLLRRYEVYNLVAR
ncbi:MAG: Dabb family protein [Chthoniobacterales bacterium]